MRPRPRVHPAAAAGRSGRRRRGGSRRHAVIFAIAVMLAAGCKGIDTGVHWQLERMLIQPRFEPYGETPFFDDRRMMRPPPEGTVPSITRPLGTVPSGALEGERYRERIPAPLTIGMLRTGQRHFDVLCAACHGVLGDGTSPVAMIMQLREPPSLLTADVRDMPVGYLFQVVERGYGLMPAYATLLSPEERWAVVAYVRALQLSQGVVLTELPPPIRAEALRRLGPPGGEEP